MPIIHKKKMLFNMQRAYIAALKRPGAESSPNKKPPRAVRRGEVEETNIYSMFIRLKVTIRPEKTMDTVEHSLIRMFRAGPEVSLKGSPTVSPTTAAL